jgi:hypothetical protein
MSAKRFKFVSPGIFLNEIDNSQIPARPEADGPVIIGRSRRGPAMRPYKVHSFEEFVRVFGSPVAGGENEDVWREGNLAGPTYAAYAARAWLASEEAPITFFRLLGEQNPYYTAGSGEAGWKNSGTPHGTLSSNGGAYGLFVCNNTASFEDIAGGGVTGSLAAIWYLEQGSQIVLSGNIRGQTDTAVTGTSALFHSDGDGAATPSQFTAQILDSDGAVKHKTAFNFNRDSQHYIRKRFNTNPMMTNSSYVDSTALNKGENLYWLGETYTTHLNSVVTGSGGQQLAFIAALESGSVSFDERQASFVNARTPWFFSQDLSSDHSNYLAENMPKLFRFHGLDHGEYVQNNIKVSIANLKPSKTVADPYGTFDVYLRAASDTDTKPVYLERYTGCSLNPDSENYIARKIGDVRTTWDTTNKVHRQYGTYANRSEYVRIEMNPDVDNALTDPELLPFGVFGPPRPLGFAVISGSTQFHQFGSAEPTDDGIDETYVRTVDITQNYRHGVGTGERGVMVTTGLDGEDPAGSAFTGSFNFPATRLRHSASDGGLTEWDKAYFGLSTDIGYDGKNESDSSNYTTRFDPGYGDYLRGLPFIAGVAEDARFDDLQGPPHPDHGNTNYHTDYSWVFSLDDVIVGAADIESLPYWSSGSRAAGTSLTALSGGYKELVDPTGSVSGVVGVNKFTAPFYGGHDGFDIREAEPFNNTDLSGNTAQSKYSFHTLERAIESIADPEAVPANILTAPGITNKTLTKQLLDVAENRADALAIIDIENVYTPRTENTKSYGNRVGNVRDAIEALRDRELNSSYGCAYYPWVQIEDPLNRQRVWVPPSVVALGTFASSQKKSAVWFAPAGFNRGGLSDPNTAGLRVLRVSERVVSKDRDRLYTVNVNPIAQFPNEGIVVFGQKTLQASQSALDRINVRRLMIFVKKEISKIAASILFDQNVNVTWQRFRTRTEGFLGSVKSSLGLTAYKVILDETTTTPDLIDRNILYAKIFLKPARSIEFIAIDFVITRTGASFDD